MDLISILFLMLCVIILVIGVSFPIPSLRRIFYTHEEFDVMLPWLESSAEGSAEVLDDPILQHFLNKIENFDIEQWNEVAKYDIRFGIWTLLIGSWRQKEAWTEVREALSHLHLMEEWGSAMTLIRQSIYETHWRVPLYAGMALEDAVTALVCREHLSTRSLRTLCAPFKQYLPKNLQVDIFNNHKLSDPVERKELT